MVACDPLERRTISLQLFQQRNQSIKLSIAVDLGHILVTGIEPIRKSTPVIEFDSDTGFVVAAYMMSNPVNRNPLLYFSRTFYVEVS